VLGRLDRRGRRRSLHVVFDRLGGGGGGGVTLGWRVDRVTAGIVTGVGLGSVPAVSRSREAGRLASVRVPRRLGARRSIARSAPLPARGGARSRSRSRPRTRRLQRRDLRHRGLHSRGLRSLRHRRRPPVVGIHGVGDPDRDHQRPGAGAHRGAGAGSGASAQQNTATLVAALVRAPAVSKRWMLYEFGSDVWLGGPRPGNVVALPPLSSGVTTAAQSSIGSVAVT
jgi:hypothetical protein